MVEDFTKINVKTYNVSLLTIGQTIKRPSGWANKILYNNKNFSIQTPLCEVLEVNTKNQPHIHLKFKLSKNFCHFQFFSNIEEIIINKIISSDTILKNIEKKEKNARESFIRTVEKISDSEMTLRIKLTASTEYFDKQKEQISGLEIKKGDNVVCLIKTQGIVSDDNTASQLWLCQQCLKYK